MICSRCGRNCNVTEKYCANCGNPMFNNQNVNQVVNNNQIVQGPMINNIQPVYIKPTKKDHTVLYCCSIIMIATIIIITGMIAKHSDNRVHFSENENNIQEKEIPTKEETRSGQTSVETDNTYYMTIKNNEEAYQQIRKDSVEQKTNCPKEIIEIENRIIKNYKVTAVNLCEMDVDYAKEVEKVVGDIYINYPTARGYLTNLSLINSKLTDNYIAFFRPFMYFIMNENGDYPVVNKTVIMLNARYFLDSKYMESAMAEAVKSGHFPKNANRYSSVSHEYAHYLSFISSLKKYNVDELIIIDASNIDSIYNLMKDFGSGENSLSIITEAYNNYKKKYNSNISLDEFRSSISGYAMAKNNEGEYIYDETIAEAFHDVYLNKEQAAPASREIVAVLKSRLE